MAEHEPSVGKTSEWYTPRYIFEALGLTFDLDPASAGRGRDCVPARKIYTKEDDGLHQSWHGLVFLNPPFGGRNGHVPWLVKFFDHGNGPTHRRPGFMSTSSRGLSFSASLEARRNSSVPTDQSARHPATASW